MKTELFKLLIIALLIAGSSYTSAEGKKKVREPGFVKEGKIEVYYFHYTRRCATCQAVENVTIETLEEFYPPQNENAKVIFKPINLDEPGSESIIKELEVSGQTLLIVAGELKENITTGAFMNAKSNPEKLKQLIKKTIDSFLEK